VWWQAVQSNWANEFAKWAPSLKAVMYDGTPDERKALRAEHIDAGGFNTLITHYDLALRDKTVLRKVRRGTSQSGTDIIWSNVSRNFPRLYSCWAAVPAPALSNKRKLGQSTSVSFCVQNAEHDRLVNGSNYIILM